MRPRLAGNPDVAGWVAAWWSGLAVAGATRRRYASMLGNHILPRFGATALSHLSRTEIRVWAAGLAVCYRPSTVASITALFTGILAEAVREGILAANPALRLRPAPQHHTRRVTLTACEVETLAEHLSGGYGLLVLTAAYTGMRWSELAALQRSRLVLTPRCDEEAVGFIPHILVGPETGALCQERGYAVPGPLKSAAAVREVHLPAFLAALLQNHLKTSFGAFVFTAARGGPLHASNFRSRVWKPALAALAQSGRLPRIGDLEAMTFHHLRHTHKTWMAEHHTPPSLQDFRIGHAPRGIQGRYEHHTHTMITELMQDLQRRHTAAKPTAAPTTELPDSPLRYTAAYATRPARPDSRSDGHVCARRRLRKLPLSLGHRTHQSR